VSRPPLLRVIALLVCVAAVAAVVYAVVGFTRGGPQVRLDGSEQRVSLPADRTYGVFINDPDNSGYTESCSIVDAGGRQVALRAPGWSISGSDTEMLDYVFDTGSGDLTVQCSVTGGEATLRAVPDAVALGLVLVGGLLLGLVGGALLLASFLTWRPGAGVTTFG